MSKAAAMTVFTGALSEGDPYLSQENQLKLDTLYALPAVKKLVSGDMNSRPYLIFACYPEYYRDAFDELLRKIFLDFFVLVMLGDQKNIEAVKFHLYPEARKIVFILNRPVGEDVEKDQSYNSKFFKPLIEILAESYIEGLIVSKDPELQLEFWFFQTHGKDVYVSDEKKVVDSAKLKVLFEKYKLQDVKSKELSSQPILKIE